MLTAYGSWPYRFAHVQDRREDLWSRMFVDSSKSLQKMRSFSFVNDNLKNRGWQEITGHERTMSGPLFGRDNGTNGPLLGRDKWSHPTQESHSLVLRIIQVF
jgi:hypothetical protein